MNLDRTLLGLSAALLLIGLLIVTSASIVVSDHSFGSPFHYFYRQLLFLIVGATAGIFAFRVPTEKWYDYSPFILLASFLFLIFVLIPGIGHQVNGSRRWFHLGPFSLQVSEFVKAGVVLFMAGYLTRREEEVRTQLSGFIKPMCVLGILSVLLLLEPDFGAATVILATSLGMMFLAGVRVWQFAALLGVVVSGLGLIAIAAPYRLARLTAFLHPWANAYDSGYQLTQSLIAFGRGGVFGVGLGNSVQKLFYLPEAHTDFVFAVLAEEFGLLGELVVVALFVWLVVHILKMGRRAQALKEKFAAYICYGMGLWLGLQVIVNIGVNLGMLPTKGLTLPFMSYGGSSIVVNCIVVGILLRISSDINGERT